MVKNVILVDAGIDIEDNYANIVKMGTTFILSIGIVGDRTYTLSITDADTTSYQINDNASQSELNVVEDMVNQLSYNEADPFDSTQTYAEGQYVIHEGQFYRCIIAVEEAGEFNINNWNMVKIGNELEELVETNKEINQNLSSLLRIDTFRLTCPTDNISNYSSSVSVALDRYTAIGIVGYQAIGNSSCYLYDAKVLDNNLYFGWRDPNKNNIKGLGFEISVLYIKNL